MRYFKGFLFFLIVFIAGISQAQDNENIELVSRFYNFSRTMYDITLQGDRLYVAAGYGVQIFDISDPENVQMTGYSDNNQDFTVQVHIRDEFLYTVEYNTGFIVYELNNPDEIEESVCIELPELTEDLFIHENRAYIINSSRGIIIFDIERPDDPRELGSFLTPGEERMINISEDGNYAFVSTRGSVIDGRWQNGGLFIYNVSDPENPVMVDEVLHENHAQEGYGVTFLRPDIAFYADHSLGLVVLNTEDPENVEIIHSDPHLHPEHEMTLNGNILICHGTSIGPHAYRTNYLKLIDISELENPELIGEVYARGIIDVRIVDDLMYMHFPDELQIANIADIQNPEILGEYRCNSMVSGIQIKDDYAYIRDEPLGIRIVNIANPAEPEEVNILEYEYTDDIEMSDNLLFCGGGDCGMLGIFNIQDLENPEEISITYGRARSAQTLKIVQDQAYVLDNLGDLSIFDISNPEEPRLLSQFDCRRQPQSIDIKGAYAFIPMSTDGLSIVDVSNPENPELALQFAPEELVPIRSVFIEGNRAYLANNPYRDIPSKLVIVDISDPLQPQVLSQTFFPGENMILGTPFVKDRFLFAPFGISGFRLFEISNIENYQQIGFFDTPGSVSRFLIKGLTAYVTNGTNVTILDFSEAIEENNTAPGWEGDFMEDSLYANPGNQIELIYMAVDNDNDVLDFKIDRGELPEEATIQQDDENRFILNWEVTIADTGDYDISMIAFDDFYSDTLNLAICVRQENAVKSNENLPVEFTIMNIYPNPFNSTTTIKYTIPLITSMSLQVFDINGRLIETLVDGILPAGMQRVVWDAGGFGGGVYFVRMRDEEGRMNGMWKVVLVR